LMLVSWTRYLLKTTYIIQHHGFVPSHPLSPDLNAWPTATDMAPVSNDAIIAIAFGLISTIIALITVYIMWKDRSSRTSESTSGKVSSPSVDLVPAREADYFRKAISNWENIAQCKEARRTQSHL